MGDRYSNRMWNQIKEDLDLYLSKVINYCYKNSMLICNPVISRNPFTSSLLLNIGQFANRINREKRKKTIFLQITKYYLNNSIDFLFFLTHFLTFKMSKLRFYEKRVNKCKDLFIIDTFIMVAKIYPEGRFDDSYFGALYEIMRKRNRQYILLCLLSGDKRRNLLRRIQTYNIIAKNERNFITEFDLMGLRDWFDLVKFIVLYPLETLKLTRQEFGKFDQFFRQEIINTLDLIHIQNYVRYLVGRNLGGLTKKKLKVISWYENQIIDKLLFRGIRDSGVKSVIYGCQFYLKSPFFVNLYPLEVESVHNVLPDVILVSGKYNLNEKSALNIKLGISPRYNYVFDIHLDEESFGKRDGLLLSLTYFIDESKRVIEIVENYHRKNADQKIAIKLHPNHLLLRPFSYPKTWEYTGEHLSQVCLRTPIVITAGSNVALEAAVMGCSVIIVGNEEGPTMHPMPEFCKGKIWDIVFDENGLEKAIERFLQYRHENPGEIIKIAKELRDMFFTQATEEKYIELFEL